MEFINLPTPVETFKSANISLTAEMEYIPSGERLVQLVHSTAEYLKKLTNSDGYIYYSLDEALGQLFVCPTKLTTEECLTKRYGWYIDRGETIAVYAFKHKAPILVDANTSADLNFPYLQDIPSLKPRYILSIPMMNFQKRCFGVVEYYRYESKQFNEIDVKVCQFMLQNCAEAIKQNENAVFFKKYNEIRVKLQGLLEKLSLEENDDKKGSYKFLYKIVEMARDITGAKSASFLFVKQNETRRIVDTDAGYSALDEDYEHNASVIIRSTASAEFNIILMQKNIHGLIKVFNKIGLPKFSITDEQILEAFTKMCTIWCTIEYSSGYLKKQASLNENILHLINIQLDNSGDFRKKLKILVTTDIRLLDSWLYNLDEDVKNKIIYSDLVFMLMRVKGEIPIPDESLKEFVVMVEQCHINNDDEVSFRNTVLSAQGLYRLLAGCKIFVAEYEKAFAMMMAVICHNVAVNNNPTSVSSIFGRYNVYANELIRFEIIQFLIEETRLLDLLSEERKSLVLQMIKEFMIDMNLECLKSNIAKFSKLVQGGGIKELEEENNAVLQSLIQSIMPAVGNMLGYFRSQEFCYLFPNFFLFDYLEKANLTCVEIIMAIGPL